MISLQYLCLPFTKDINDLIFLLACAVYMLERMIGMTGEVREVAEDVALVHCARAHPVYLVEQDKEST
jgi:hypothetical protein